MAKDFNPRVNRCNHCAQLKEANPVSPTEKQCGVFGWLIRNAVAKRQAVCKETGPSKFMGEEV